MVDQENEPQRESSAAGGQPDPARPDVTDQACQRCGRFGAFDFDGQLICGDCAAAVAACCAGEFEAP